MHPRCPTVAQFLLDAAAGKFQPAFVKERCKLVGTQHANHRGCRVGDASETLLAFAQSLFSALFVGQFAMELLVRQAKVFSSFQYSFFEFSAQPAKLQLSPNAGQQLPMLQRFGNKVNRTNVESFDVLLLAVRSTKENNRNITSL